MIIVFNFDFFFCAGEHHIAISAIVTSHDGSVFTYASLQYSLISTASTML